MGASSGGGFCFFVYKALRAKAIASYISPGIYSDEELSQHSNKTLSPPLPPIAYIYMTKDGLVTQHIEHNKKMLEQSGVIHQLFPVDAHPLTPQLCAERLPEVGLEHCALFLATVTRRSPHLIQPETYEIQKSYLGGEWRDAMNEMHFHEGILKARLSLGLSPMIEGSKRGELSPISPSGHSWLWAAVEEEIAAAHGVHEMTSDHIDQVLDFLMLHAKVDSPNNNNNANSLYGISSSTTTDSDATKSA